MHLAIPDAKSRSSSDNGKYKSHSSFKNIGDKIMSNVRNIHFEAVGSYLRPAELKEARAKFADGKISATDLRSRRRPSDY